MSERDSDLADAPTGADAADTAAARPTPGFRRFAAKPAAPEASPPARPEADASERPDPALPDPVLPGSVLPEAAHPEPAHREPVLPEPGSEPAVERAAPRSRETPVDDDPPIYLPRPDFAASPPSRDTAQAVDAAQAIVAADSVLPAPPPAAAPPSSPAVAAAPSPPPAPELAFRPSPPRPTEATPRDLQGELDASVGCAEWFDRRPVPAPPPPPPPAAPLYSVTAAEAAPAIALPTFDPPRDEAALRPLRAPRTAFDGGDVGAGPDRLAALLGYLLLIVGAPTAGAGLVLAFLLAWRLEKDVVDWRRSHFQFQRRTAMIALGAGFACGLALFIDYVGMVAAPVLVLLTGWVVLRAALGLHHLFQGRPHPNYMTWFA